MTEHRRPFSEELASNFRRDIETIAQSLVGFCELSHAKAVPNLDDALLRWLDFRLRFVDPKPRPLVYSKIFAKCRPRQIRRALRDFERRSLAGEDLNPFQGKGLTKHHDTSGLKRQSRTDLLWADWNIHHFHLGPRATGTSQYYAARTSQLLFAVVFDNAIACIDVGDHGSMEDRSLIEAFVRSWPDAAERYRLKGLLPGSSQLSAADIRHLRVGGVSSPLVVDGAVYMPGGITTASTPMNVSWASVRIDMGIEALALIAIDQVTRDRGAWGSADLPHISLAVTPQGIGIYDDRSDRCWRLPRGTAQLAGYPIGHWHDLMLPEWIEGKIAAVAG